MNSQNTDSKSKSFLRSGWTVVLLMALSAAVGQSFGRFSYGVLLPAVRDDMNISNTLAGFIGGANVGAYLVGTLLVSWLAGRYRLLGIMRLGLLMVVVGLFGAAFSSSPLALAAALALAGVGGALLWIPAPVVAADAVASHQRPLAVGMMGSGIGLGVVFASSVSGSLRSSLGDAAWSSVYQIQFVIGLVVMLAVLLLVRHQQANPSGGGGLGGFSALQRMQGWLPLILAYACFGFMYLLVLGFLTTRLEDDSGWSSANASWAFSLLGMAMIFGGPLFTTMAQRLACDSLCSRVWSVAHFFPRGADRAGRAGLAGLCGHRLFVQRTAQFDHALCGRKYDSRRLWREFRSGDLSVRRGADGFATHWRLDSRCSRVVYAGVFVICDNQCYRVDRHTASAPKCTVGLTFT